MLPQTISNRYWGLVFSSLRESAKPSTFQVCFQNLKLVKIGAEKATLSVNSEFEKKLILKKHKKELLEAINRYYPQVIIVDLEVDQVLKTTEISKNKETGNIFEQNQESNFKAQIIMSQNNNANTQVEQQIFGQKYNFSGNKNVHNLNPKYTFETFVPTDSSKLAHTVANNIAENLGTLYNPFFLYSAVGLGKTHLLQALGHKALELEPSLNIKYLTSEKFFQHFVTAVQANKTKEFKEFYRQIDLLLIDDIQFLSGKEATQETFFHLFNELHQLNKQIVIASDRHPKSLMGMEDRLLSRFEWGINIDIQIPTLEDKTAVISFKSLKMGLGLSDEQIQIIAQNQSTNYRDIEGILNRIQAKQSITKTMEVENWEIKKLSGNSPVSNIISLSYVSNIQENINKIVLEIFGVSWEEVVGNSRKKHISTARQILMFVYRNHLKMSYITIGKIFGKDHSTVIHSCEKIANSEKFEIKSKLDKIQKMLQQIHS